MKIVVVLLPFLIFWFLGMTLDIVYGIKCPVLYFWLGSLSMLGSCLSQDY